MVDTDNKPEQDIFRVANNVELTHTVANLQQQIFNLVNEIGVVRCELMSLQSRQVL